MLLKVFNLLGWLLVVVVLCDAWRGNCLKATSWWYLTTFAKRKFVGVFQDLFSVFLQCLFCCCCGNIRSVEIWKHQTSKTLANLWFIWNKTLFCCFFIMFLILVEIKLLLSLWWREWERESEQKIYSSI